VTLVPPPQADIAVTATHKTKRADLPERTIGFTAEPVLEASGVSSHSGIARWHRGAVQAAVGMRAVRRPLRALGAGPHSKVVRGLTSACWVLGVHAVP
jgi:hypothetical protein